MPETTMTDAEILRRAAQLNRTKDEAYRQKCMNRERARIAALEKADQEFAASIGVTWEQYQDIENRVHQRIWDEK